MRTTCAISLLGITLALVGCGGSALQTESPATESPGTKSTRSVDDLATLEHELEQSEQELLASLGQTRAGVSQPRDGAPAAEPTAPPSGGAAPGQAAPAPPASEAVDSDEAATSEQRASTPCDIACRAFASMRRSALRICELAGSEDDRCGRARQRVDRARDQISSAGCRCPQQD